LEQTEVLGVRRVATSHFQKWQLEEISFQAKDGRALAGRLHLPGTEPRFAVVLHGGIGFPASFYADFALWLARTHDVAVLTYDYRDFGRSGSGSLSRSATCLSHWAIDDQSGALTYLAGRFPSVPLRVIGHSLGGQWLAFHDDIAKVDRVVAVASGPTHWRDHPQSSFARILAFWWLLGPLAVTLFGYLPGRRLGFGADIPGGVYWEWRHLCRQRDYHRAFWGTEYPVPGLDRAKFKLAMVAVEDDPLVSPAIAGKLASYYPAAKAGLTLLRPIQLALASIGHAGAFTRKRKACWPWLVAPLLD
jgi:predicted alpha/beta hydrolase